MVTTKLNIGKIPISKGEYQKGTTYQRLNQVTMLGSTYQSKIDDNTSAPAQMGADGAVENINTDKWLCIAVGNVSAAKKVVYNNETSGLEAGNVQEAIDEVGSKVSDLSEGISNISESDGAFLGNATTNLFDINRMAFNGRKCYINGSTGKISATDSSIHVSHLIQLKEGIKKITLSCNEGFEVYLGYRFFDTRRKVISYGTLTKEKSITLNIPENAYLFQFSFIKGLKNIQVEYGDRATAYVSYPIVQDPEVLEKISKLSIENNKQDSVIATKANYEDISTFLDYGFITTIGDINNTQSPNEWVNTSLLRFDKEHDIIFYGDNTNDHINVLAFYDHNKKYISGLSNVTDEIQRVQAKDIPSNAEYVCVCAKNDKDKLKILHFVPYIDKPTIYKSILESTDYNGNIIKLSDVPNVKFGQSIALYAKVTSFKKVTVYHGRIAYAGGKVEIDDSNIYAYHLDASSKFGQYPHGLEIKEFFSITINQSDTKTAKLIINTLGGMFVQDIPWTGSYGDIECEFEDSVISDAKLTYSNSDFKKDIWAFGDSYFDYLTPKLRELGYNNALFDSYSGRMSAQALISLKLMLNVFGKPKYVYWAMGMNDADNKDSVNESWKNTYDELVSICKTNDITLVFATIPKTPTHNNDFKNYIIEISGYRYVDIYKAVVKNSDGSWYDNYLESDNTHPKEKGINAIVSRMALDFPELKG